ncbi:uncharacterized protein LOC125259006 [Megalobrama amblycephala]|uniref:uncharacterized protein LOC125259006 n=1 Tax=Megalobrama amblycephala TaxID=75352 RepID=UPI002013DEF6|nr:uncharacterized protein LOC125259006 [Megalobrama amblycephala]
MRQNIMSSRLLLLSALCMATSVSLGNAQCNTTHSNETGSCSLTTERTSNQTLDNCNLKSLNNFSSLIQNAVDNTTHQLQCISNISAGFPQEKLQMLQKELGKIITSTLNVMVYLEVSSMEDIAESFGALHTLTEENAQNMEFVQSWLCVRLIPILPFITTQFISNMSKINFSCVSYQAIVKTFNEKVNLVNGTVKFLIYKQFMQPFLSREHSDPACLIKTTSSADWLEKNFGNFSSYATLEDLKSLNGNFSSFESLALLTPAQVAELTLSSGVLNNTNQISAVFDRLEEGDAFKNTEEFLTALSSAPEIPDISPAVRDVMMNRTFIIIQVKIKEFEAPDWVVWFTVKLEPILPSFTAEMLVKITADINCTNYQVIVEGLGTVFPEMTLLRTQEITKVLVEHLKEFATLFSSPGCRQSISSDAEWLNANLGPFTTVANYSDLKALNVSGLAALETLSPDQKAELLFDPTTGALENVTVVEEVLSSILQSPDEKQLEKFFEKFVEVSKEENITYITNGDVRDTMLNLTLTALAPKFPLFQTSDYELWFQINLVVLLASFRPTVLVLIPTNLTCDSYNAILKGLENALAVLPSDLKEELRSSKDKLRQSPPQGCTPPLPVDFFESLALLTPAQVAELTLSSGVLNNTNQISAVFDRLEKGDAHKNVEEFSDGTELSS